MHSPIEGWMFVAVRPLHSTIILELLDRKLNKPGLMKSAMGQELILLRQIMEQACLSESTSLEG